MLHRIWILKEAFTGSIIGLLEAQRAKLHGPSHLPTAPTASLNLEPHPATASSLWARGRD